MVWLTCEPGHIKPIRKKVRQAVLVVIGSGRAAMVFVSEPPPEGDADGESAGQSERTACLKSTIDYVTKFRPGGVNILQALPDPIETWATAAYRAAEFTSVGILTYMRGPVNDVITRIATYKDQPKDRWKGWTLRDYESLRAEHGTIGADDLFVSALDSTYLETLDCPELCGMRDTRDVLESHRATGKFDPRYWWLLIDEAGVPGACLLLNPCPEQRTIELVYLGLAPATRGRGIGRALITYGLGITCATRNGWDVACAVDDRNAPARNLYESLGFVAFGKRAALVKQC